MSVAAAAFDTEDFLRRAASGLHREPPTPGAVHAAARGDHDGNEDAPRFDEAKARPASVLVPVVAHPDGPTLLLTRRTAHLRAHPGQIAFPGGRVDPGDPSYVHAACREAWEEVGLDPSLPQPLGFLDPYVSSTGFRIVPVVARLEPGFALALNPDEVEEAFEVPLGFLMDPANHQRHSREWQGTRRYYYAMPHGARYIWGVTAGIIRNLHDRLYGGS